MSINEMINEKDAQSILYAPKLKFKKPTIFPTPFFLNEQTFEEENNYNESYENSSDDEEDINLNNYYRRGNNSIGC